MRPRLLLDTHILLRWLYGSKRLSREQTRVIDNATKRDEPLGVGSVSLLEISILVEDRKLEITGALDTLLESLNQTPFQLLPLTPAVAFEAGAMASLKDPFDRALAATARVHGLRLVTSDQRIISSHLVSTIE
ncbi:MAG TPA: type II toxin-antitoxin system VapC family toxin [Bryobacteraceae bacterium]|jgi:PIN domain nuclease of toxin-antitoxin system